MSYDYAVGRTESLQFLRSDQASDFRVAAIAEYPWGGNGWNIWGIPGVYGWNPLMLPPYGEYVRSFTQTSRYALPFGGSDHRLESPLLDLLGAKYLLVTDVVDQEQGLARSAKFEKVFESDGWWRIYRNSQFLSRAWFYPRAYVVPEDIHVIALMNSRWFDPRRALVFSSRDLPPSLARLATPLPTITLLPEHVVASLGGAARPDPACAEERSLWGDWDRADGWILFDLSEAPQEGRYTALVEYAAAGPTPPEVVTSVAQGSATAASAPVVLPRTTQWACSDSRLAELGEFDLEGVATKITIALQRAAPLNVYRLWLVRLPDDPALMSGEEEPARGFSFHDFEVSENRYAFRAELPRAGFVLVNEIFYPGWEATVDGQSAEILRAGHIFRALALPAGSHRIEMRFRPRHFWLGAAVSLLTLITLLWFFLVAGRWRQAFEKPRSF
jgi:hypothetical protein